ncbi:hypothetical protein KUCAC02_029818, partial [Chaenocephalus aceratus]
TNSSMDASLRSRRRAVIARRDRRENDNRTSALRAHYIVILDVGSDIYRRACRGTKDNAPRGVSMQPRAEHTMHYETASCRPNAALLVTEERTVIRVGADFTFRLIVMTFVQ